MKRILIISSGMREQELLFNVANNHRPGDFGFDTTASFGQDATYWNTQAPDVLIMSLPDDDLLQGYYFTKLRKDVRRDQAIIFICSAISSPLMQMSLHFTKVRMMKTPIDATALYRAVIDLTQEYDENHKQISPRYMTEQNVEVRSDGHEGKIKAIMKNLSVTGAYFETLEPGFPIRSGDFVRLSVHVGNPGKLYVFDVRVVWAAEKKKGQPGYGCVFVDKDEVYNNLLKNI